MRLLLKIIVLTGLILAGNYSYSQDKPADAAASTEQKPKTPPAKKQDGPKAPSAEDVARELLASGEAKKKIGKFDEAIADFDAALEKYPELYEVYVARASCHFLKLDFNSAMADYDRAVEIIETEVEKLKTQAKIKRVLQDAAGEKKEMDKVIKLQPLLSEAYYQRGNLKQFTDDMSGCCEDIRKSKELGHLQADTKIQELCGGGSESSGE